MKLPLFQIDAFADRVFTGNPAAVVPLSAWLPDELLQSIALENNLSETAFFVADGRGFHLRWFTPEAEVDLCGHATLASAHVLFEHLGYTGMKLNFQTRSGELTVTKVRQGLSMDFPAIASEPIDAPPALLSGLGATPVEVRAAPDYLAIFASEQEIINLAPDFSALAQLDRRGVIATAPGNECDFVSRCFYPKLKVNEDPVTGSAHCKMAPYWAKRLNKTTLVGRQLSNRGGTVHCELVGNRVILTGRAVDYLKGEIELPD
ncbi:MAG: PhzF family phenazine biosynthesis protein [Wenzhouxiangella sp.]